MKAKYTTPVMEIIEFEVEDIITTSGNGLIVDTIQPDSGESELPAIGVPN